MSFKALIPELTVTNLQTSLGFYRAPGFRPKYDWPEDRFAFLSLERHSSARAVPPPGWNLAALEHPLRPGISLQTKVDEIGSMLDTLQTIAYPLHRSLSEPLDQDGRPANRRVGVSGTRTRRPSAAVLAILRRTGC